MKYPTYLMHYGTPGQKWGIRKYQNEDGTWTEEGKERRRVDPSKLPHYGGKGIQGPLNSAGYYEKNEHGFNKYDNNGNKIITGKVKGPDETDYVIKKGSTYSRVTSQKDEKFNKRMYVGGGKAFNEEFDTLYKETLSGLLSSNDMYINTLETKRDVVIAGRKTVESILKEIGGEDVNKILKAFDSKDEPRPKMPSKKYGFFGNKTKEYKQYEKERDRWEEISNEKTKRIDFLYRDEYKIADKFIKKLKDRGYDGLSDPADGTLINKNGLDPDATIFVNDVLKMTKQRKY